MATTQAAPPECVETLLFFHADHAAGLQAQLHRFRFEQHLPANHAN